MSKVFFDTVLRKKLKVGEAWKYFKIGWIAKRRTRQKNEDRKRERERESVCKTERFRYWNRTHISKIKDRNRETLKDEEGEKN